MLDKLKVLLGIPFFRKAIFLLQLHSFALAAANFFAFALNGSTLSISKVFVSNIDWLLCDALGVVRKEGGIRVVMLRLDVRHVEIDIE